MMLPTPKLLLQQITVGLQSTSDFTQLWTVANVSYPQRSKRACLVHSLPDSVLQQYGTPLEHLLVCWVSGVVLGHSLLGIKSLTFGILKKGSRSAKSLPGAGSGSAI